jgi:predicted AAA+ superfamily ATPase
MQVSRILDYTAHLANAFLIHQVPRCEVNGKRIFEVGEKYYFENLGIRNAIVGYRPVDAGKLLENAVYNHLLYTGWKVAVGVLPSGEIDFVCEKSGETKYVQVALRLDSAKTIDREFGNLGKINDNYPKYVITTDATSPNTHAGIAHLHIRKFLMQE